jgi:hypothetical protein
MMELLRGDSVYMVEVIVIVLMLILRLGCMCEDVILMFED